MTTTPMTHQEMTKHIRQRIQKAGIKASVVKQTSCRINQIRVSTRTYEQQFTIAEQKQIIMIAKTNGLVGSHQLPLNPLTPFGQEAWFTFNG